MPDIRIAFVGFRHGHITSLYDLADQTVGVCIAGACEEHGPTRASLQENGVIDVSHAAAARLLDEVDCDVIAVGDAFGLRGSRAIAALEAGRHVIVDKPLCTRLEELSRIRVLAREKDLQVGCMLTMRDSAGTIAARQLIRAGKIAAICTTGANLEEDVFNLVAHDHYVRIPDWRTLSAKDDEALRAEGYNRVTDTAIPEEQAIRKLEAPILSAWKAAEASGESKFPHRFLYDILLSGELDDSYQAQARDSWLLAAAEAELPIFTPGWEDSTLGNIFAARIIDGTLAKSSTVKGGIEAMLALAEWYRGDERPAGLLQIGGGIAGDFPICVVPMLRQDLGQDAELWSWFAQISEATTSYGGYSGATPEEKISWGKLAVDTPKFVIESDATIVLPLLFAAILDW